MFSLEIMWHIPICFPQLSIGTTLSVAHFQNHVLIWALWKDGSTTVVSLMWVLFLSSFSIFRRYSVVTKRSLQSAGKNVISKGLSLLSHQSRMEIIQLISPNKEGVWRVLGQNDVWIFLFISQVDKLLVVWYRWCQRMFLCHDQVQVRVSSCQSGVSPCIPWKTLSSQVAVIWRMCSIIRNEMYVFICSYWPWHHR